MTLLYVAVLATLTLISVLVGAFVTVTAQAGDTTALAAAGATGGAFLVGLVAATVYERRNRHGR